MKINTLFKILGVYPAMKPRLEQKPEPIATCGGQGSRIASEMLLTQKKVNEHNAREIKSEYLLGYEARTEWDGEKKTGEISIFAVSEDKARETLNNYFGLIKVFESEIKYVKRK